MVDGLNMVGAEAPTLLETTTDPNRHVSGLVTPISAGQP